MSNKDTVDLDPNGEKQKQEGLERRLEFVKKEPIKD